LAWLDPGGDKQKEQKEMIEKRVQNETRHGVEGDGDRPETHQSKRSQASMRQVQVVTFTG
jgi:hypothetical protein